MGNLINIQIDRYTMHKHPLNDQPKQQHPHPKAPKPLLTYQGQIIIKNGCLLIENHVLPYENQVIYDHNKLYLTQIGKTVLIDDTLLLFDDQFFYFNLQKQLLEQLQVSDSSIGLDILSNMPKLKQSDFSYLLSTLSIEKLQQILLDDQFFLFLIVNFQYFVYKNSIKSQDQRYLQKNVIGNMTSIYQRLLYLLHNIEGITSKIRSSLQILSNQMMLTAINQPNFITKLAYYPENNSSNKPTSTSTSSSSKQQLFNHHFIIHLTNIINFMQYISSPIIEQQRQINGTFFISVINELIFTKQCINIIAINFHQIFLYQRKKLLLVLCLIVKLKHHSQIWNDIIFNEYLIVCQSKNEQPDELQSNNHNDKLNQIHHQTHKDKVEKIKVNNKNSFKNLILNSYLNCTSDNWATALYLLEQLTNSKITICNESFYLLVNIFEEVIELGIGIEEIQVICRFIIQHRLKIQQHSKFRLFVSHFLEIIYRLVQKEFKIYEIQKMRYHNNSQQNPYIKKQPKLIITSKIHTKLLCCLLRVFSKLFQKHVLSYFLDYQYLSSIERLFQMSKGKKGMIEGIKKHFIKLIKEQFMKQGQHKIEKKKINSGMLESYSNKKYGLNQKKNTETTLEKLMKMVTVLNLC